MEYFTVITLSWSGRNPLTATVSRKVTVTFPYSQAELYLYCLKQAAQDLKRNNKHCSISFWYAGPDEIKEPS